MTVKKQTDFTFDEAKKVAIHHLSEVANFMENLNNMFPSKVPLLWAIHLRTIEAKVNQSSNPCLIEKEIELIQDLAKSLIHGNPDAVQQLTQFWNLHVEVLQIVSANPKTYDNVPENILNKNASRIAKGDALAEKLVLEAKNNPSTFTSPVTLLLAHVVRTETVEYAFWKHLTNIVERFGLTNYNVALICSVYGAVNKYNKRTKQYELRSDVRAIRDSIAHGHFLIRKSANSYEIEFDNEDYPFHKVFSTKEFYKFFDLHTILWKTQFTLLFIIELLPILTTHFLKKSLAK
jgi:hypothetical protein